MLHSFVLISDFYLYDSIKINIIYNRILEILFENYKGLELHIHKKATIRATRFFAVLVLGWKTSVSLVLISSCSNIRVFCVSNYLTIRYSFFSF